MKRQQTISREVEWEGVGLFTSQPVTLRLRPAEPQSGICFVRTDQDPPVRIPATLENITRRARRTALGNGAVAVETIEHCLSACAGLGVDNIQIELNGPELPGGDGSGLPFVQLLREAGICAQDAAWEPQVVADVVRVVEGDSELVALPPLPGGPDTLEVTYDLDYGPQHPIGRQVYHVTLSPEAFMANIAPARTFALEEEARQMQAAGLARHLTARDILVFGRDGPIDNELRFPDECARHKALDLIGDLVLLGRPLVGRVLARRSGHTLNHELVRALLEQRTVQEQARLLTRAAPLDIRKILRILPHRYPLLLIDRILKIEGTQRIVGVKNVTINEEYFQGHYPGDPIMPGVLIIEALAQIGGVLLGQALEHRGKVAVLLSLDKVKFRRAVRPGDQLILEAEALRVRASTGHVRGQARVGADLAAEAEIKFILTDQESQ
ncbi:MAG TPA: UDP-3-O-acyl-N-acetylglucosamine deacetylase [Phycisphaerae bacterium]|nr:UDP-3-O-acyl-N-acetylglucosamine deacetylase [Phycisphaerae bacterium]HNU46707.1 UDP-3-O-acyl-N-acetylglucosamine deacetylase [Phycisphaerae bacterium]